MECKKCALNAIESINTWELLEDLVNFYRKDWMEDIAKAQIYDTKALLSSRLRKVLDSCDIPGEAPLVHVVQDLEAADTLDKIRWSIQNLDGALYQSLKGEGAKK